MVIPQGNNFKSLSELLKQNAYDAIKFFRDFAKGEISVNFEQFRGAMTEFCKNQSIPQEDIAHFWSSYKTEGNLFYFEEQLM